MVAAGEDEKTQLAHLRNDFGEYYLTLNKGYRWALFQQKIMIPALMQVAQHWIKALMVLMPPRHGKSDLVTKNFLPWCFGRWPNENNMLLSYSDIFAKRFGRAIRDRLKNEIHMAVFPGCRLPPATGSTSYFRTTAGGEFFSAGFKGTINGQGVNRLLVIDDPLKNMTEARSPEHNDKLMETYNSTVRTRVEGASTIMATTRWARGDFVDRVLDQEGLASQGGKWTVIKLPAEAPVGDPFREPGTFLFPERYPDSWYTDHKFSKHATTWPALFQQEPRDLKGMFFRKEWLNFYPNLVRPAIFPAYMICDPALGTNREHDRTVILVFCSTPDRRLLLVDAVVGRLDPGQRAEQILNLVRRWRPARFIYEEIGLMSDTWELEIKMRNAGLRFYPISVGRKGPRHLLSKEQRITELISDFREGRIWLPAPAEYANYRVWGPHTTVVGRNETDAEPVDIIDQFVNEEYLMYAGAGTTPHDDVLDAMSRIHDHELAIVYPLTKKEIDEATESRRNRVVRKGSWETAF